MHEQVCLNFRLVMTNISYPRQEITGGYFISAQTLSSAMKLSSEEGNCTDKNFLSKAKIGQTF